MLLASDRSEFQHAFTRFAEQAKAGELEAALPYAEKVYVLSQSLFPRLNANRLAAAENYALTLKQLAKDAQAERVFQDLLEQQQTKFGNYAAELTTTLADLSELALSKQKSQAYQLRFEKIYLRHNSSEFIEQLTSADLETSQLAPKITEKIQQSFDRSVTIHETQHWSLVAVGSSEKFAKNAARLLEKTYLSMLSFRIAMDYPPTRLNEKMTAVYFETREQQQIFSRSARWARGKFATLILNKNGKRFPAINIAKNASRHAGAITGLERRVKGKPPWLFEGLSKSFQFADVNNEFGPHTDNYLLQSIVQIKNIIGRGTAPGLRKIVSYTGASLPYRDKAELQAFYPFLVRYLYTFHPEQLAEYFVSISSYDSKVSAPAFRAEFEEAFGEIEQHEQRFERFLQDMLAEGEIRIAAARRR